MTVEGYSIPHTCDTCNWYDWRCQQCLKDGHYIKDEEFDNGHWCGSWDAPEDPFRDC